MGNTVRHNVSFHFISFHFVSFHFIKFYFLSFHLTFISFHLISKPRVSDAWAHRRFFGTVRNKGFAPRFSTVSSWTTRPRQGQRPRPLLASLYALDSLDPQEFFQQSGAEWFDQKIRTPSSHQWRAKLQSFQETLVGDKSECLKFVGRRMAPTQCCLRT